MEPSVKNALAQSARRLNPTIKKSNQEVKWFARPFIVNKLPFSF